MKLKDYQRDALEGLSEYLKVLRQTKQDVEDYAAFQQSKGKSPAPQDFCRDAWEAHKPSLPQARRDDGTFVTPDYVPRFDGRKRPIPSVCMKVPTGGGKTLMAALAVDRINAEYRRSQTGLVLWVVPSDAIYDQTWRTLANREHPYRQMLERASGGRVKLLEKNDGFTKQDVGAYLCVMLIMLQAGAVKESTKEARKMFQDSGRYPTFFPDVDDATANAAMLATHPDLETNDLTDETFKVGGLAAKQSLANVLRLSRPLVVIDEGHKAYSETALDFIARHNPSFILELSATPNAKKHISNIVVNVTGKALKDEEMIKLPINIVNKGGADWKAALNAAKDKLDDLTKLAKKVKNNENRYIRPILLIRVELTGDDQRDKGQVHAEDVRSYLRDKLGVDESEIKVQSASKKELEEIDKNPAYLGKGLLSDLCPVRYIITKDALREGWDCPFAYILAALSRTTAATAMTQMVGRVLRQPEAKRTKIDALNECYVFTHDQDVQTAVDSVRKGLEEEGMGDLGDSVRAAVPGGTAGSRRETLKRRASLKGVQVFMPRVLSRHFRTGEWRPFDYERDLLPKIDWTKITYTGKDTFALDARQGISHVEARVDLGGASGLSTPSIVREEIETAESLDVGGLVRLLTDAVPNPWEAFRILDEALAALRKRPESELSIYANRLALIESIKDDVRRQVSEAGEAEFRRMLKSGELSFQLRSSGDPSLNWALAQELELNVSDADAPLRHRNGAPVAKSFLEPVYQGMFTGLEKDVALYLDGDAAVRWWHRIAVQQDWYLQGWQRRKVYPDFLASVHTTANGVAKFTVLETKGLHLKGNEDTDYKERLFKVLSEHAASATPVGELVLGSAGHELRFELLLENDWRTRIGPALQHV